MQASGFHLATIQPNSGGRVRVREIDRLKRTVAELILPEGRNLNQDLVRAGFAWWYRQFARYDRGLAELENETRAAKPSLWADPNRIAPREWREQGAVAFSKK